MKKALGLVLLATFFIGALSAWTYFEQESRHRQQIERLTRPKTIARVTVLSRDKTPDGHYRTTVEVEDFDALLCTDDAPEPSPGATFTLILDSDGNPALIPAQTADH